jgi:hypothetical protein
VDPLGYRDPFGLDGWGNDFADWLDSKIDAVQRYLNLLMSYTNHGIEGYARVIFSLRIHSKNRTAVETDEELNRIPKVRNSAVSNRAGSKIPLSGTVLPSEWFSHLKKSLWVGNHICKRASDPLTQTSVGPSFGTVATIAGAIVEMLF